MVTNTDTPQRTRVLPAARASAVRGRVRLRTLSNLRWMATGGQGVAVIVVYFGFGYALPFIQCMACIAFSAGLNVALGLRYPPTHRLTNGRRPFISLTTCCSLRFCSILTGGIANPFALMFVAPVVIAASTLNSANTLILAPSRSAATSWISVVHDPLPWSHAEHLILPPLYQAGRGRRWCSASASLRSTPGASPAKARACGRLAATQLALAREQRLSSLGALATAAAHELGSPLRDHRDRRS